MRNEMMHRPVIDHEVLAYLRRGQMPLTGQLGNIEAVARKKGIPIIPAETAAFISTLFKALQPQNVLEVGTAIGFSAALMLTAMPENGHVTTIDRFPTMQERAKANFELLNISKQVTQLAGDAATILPNLTGIYDVVFMDSAKAKYLDFLSDCLRLVKQGGVILIDDILQGGTILDSPKTIRHRDHAIHRKLNLLLDYVFREEQLQASLLPLGDGLLMITKLTAGPFHIPN
ncbi:O-methyltransferase [Loigolactobacillus backii]|uniref:tRNA 5-hydroxyuridine methyltransferase n=1 Tax=Loigolactobacillus backii TaxID=375175 RepID=A0A192H0K8_9LACO|nr:O-methyltransferase [Loigolactobacillus backii]ANK60229.1 methyltransferase [Loigolactobacillus backii]ANK62329.1 methyltransferase [Loigolactobacillus backii]ANK65111.1 methyltransferase [Loigolactobacillus backii]ANK67670.1 methyltransferase [Loigolactobacillus backii]ANK70658.1 methyltransferase [Loigolactobacillus backii]